MKYNISDVSSRLKGTRECLDISTCEMAKKINITEDEYISLESGEKDFSLSFLNECAEILGIELIELLTGVTPTLQKYSIVRSGEGLPIERRIGFTYQHLAYLFKNKKIEPLIVTAPFEKEQQNKPIHLSVHDGQEMNYIISGKMKFIIGEHTEILSAGDCIYFDSTNPHGMIAIDDKNCTFLAILI